MAIRMKGKNNNNNNDSSARNDFGDFEGNNDEEMVRKRRRCVLRVRLQRTNVLRDRHTGTLHADTAMNLLIEK